ncbi:MAG: RNA-binding protein [Euryarchaeota archaeon]|nr:RNA-binding protein [Euryarchaeota archaeon]
MKLSSGDLSPVAGFISKYPGEEVVIRGDLKNKEQLHKIMIEIVREKMKDGLSDDYILMQTLDAYDDVITILNLMSERLIELRKIESIKDVSLDETQAVNAEIERLTALRDYLEDSIKNRCAQLIPNLTALVGDIIAARLISYAGGLERLARMPASTIQVLGAEDKFFQHLKKGTPCPKHGIIFQVFEVRSLPPRLRGRAARALAGKLAIAARVDYYRGDFIGHKLKEEFKKRVEEIKNDTGRKGR